MKKKRAADILSAHLEVLLGHPEAIKRADVSDEEEGELASLFTLAEQLQHDMSPVQPSEAFVNSLGRELASSAPVEIAAARRTRRNIRLSVAIIGTLLYTAALIGSIMYMISCLRAKSSAE
jgi:hypothetical protein